jgi:hypothetical protein
MPEFVLQLWAAMVMQSARPLTTLQVFVPPEHRSDVADRVSTMVRRRSIQDRLSRVRAIQAERGC